MNLNFSQKERTLLEDQKSHEQICIQKYSNYASLTSDPQLKNIFEQNGRKEQEHLDTINQLLNGQMPATNQSGSSGQQQGGSSAQQQGGQQQGGQQQGGQQQGGSGQRQQTSQMTMERQQPQSSGSFMPSSKTTNYNNSDKDLCTDILMTEKYVSGTYNTAIFEFRDVQVRDILNHIQKEEQKHGESVFKYMESKGMYSVQ